MQTALPCALTEDFPVLSCPSSLAPDHSLEWPRHSVLAAKAMNAATNTAAVSLAASPKPQMICLAPILGGHNFLKGKTRIKMNYQKHPKTDT